MSRQVGVLLVVLYSVEENGSGVVKERFALQASIDLFEVVPMIEWLNDERDGKVPTMSPNFGLKLDVHVD